MSHVLKKTCTRCKVEKDWTEFTFLKAYGRLNNICKVCNRKKEKTKELEIIKRNSMQCEFRVMGHNMAVAAKRGVKWNRNR